MDETVEAVIFFSLVLSLLLGCDRLALRPIVRLQFVCCATWTMHDDAYAGHTAGEQKTSAHYNLTMKLNAVFPLFFFFPNAQRLNETLP